MSVAVLIGVHDGVVLAADSASTLSIPAACVRASTRRSGNFVVNVYDNANKIFKSSEGPAHRLHYFGSGNIGNASVGTLIKDLRKKLTESPKEMEFNADAYTMEKIATILAKFLGDECAKLEPPAKLNTSMGILLGGYSKPGDLGESWSVGNRRSHPPNHQKD